MALASGTRFGSYEVVSQIGAGGMGEVYQAHDTKLGRDVAIKVLPANFVNDPERLSRFQREARMLAALNHANIATIYGLEQSGGVTYLVMELVPGETLAERVKAGPLPIEEVLKIAVQIAEALEAAHEKSIIHRDLKPANVKVTPEGKVKLLDFGLAKAYVGDGGLELSDAPTLTSMRTQEGQILGTPAYMSPEQALGKAVDKRADIWAFGCVLYELLTGRRTFEGQSSAALLSAVMRDDPNSLSEINSDIPPEVRRIVTRCLKKDPAERFASGAELAAELKICRDPLFTGLGAILSPARIIREVQRPRVLVPLLLTAILLVTGAVWVAKGYRDARWAREVALPEISQLSDEGKFGDAYALAMKAEESIPGDSALAKLWAALSYQLSLVTTPPGVDVYRRDYVKADAPWELVGKTPLKNVRQPRGMFVWKFEKPGFGTVLQTTLALIPRIPVSPGDPVEASVTLDEAGNIPAGMVRVSPAKSRRTLYIPGYEGMPELALKDYWIDQYEITNRQFKLFVDQGGYQKREYWKIDFQREGKRLSWGEAMALFRDSAGRPGPKDWIQGEYPKGQDSLPVTGISWYEAAAYAEFAGKSLPTIYHWNRAAGPFSAALIVPASNFGGPGILPVGSKPDLSPWGNYDMAGNVKEWIWTEAESGKRYVLGGAWDEPNYMFIDPDAQSPFLRAANIGFRCVKYIEPGSIPKIATDPMPSPRRDLTKEKPTSDQLFQAYRGIYSYDKKPLNPSVEPFGQDEEAWKAEKITYTAAYGNERAIAYLFLPKRARPPFQTVLFFPGSNALQERTFSLPTAPILDAVLRSGRAVLYPVYKSTYERGDGMESDVANETSDWRDHVVMWVKDASRAIDYAETRPELDHSKLAYYGFSWGAEMGGIVPAVEPRIKVSILALGGLDFHRSLPEVDTINFIPRVKQPVLMLNGRYDFFFPVESTQEPFFHMLGSAKDQKKHLLYDTGHNIPRNELIKETLNWLDQYLGPVN
jgi:formylglycine-generating enzyme required for sulfatase activity/dienelactone hydrolase/fructosamine-3-kinase